MEGTGIRETVIEEIRGLAKRHGVRKVILFGSRARGDYGRASDTKIQQRNRTSDQLLL